MVKVKPVQNGRTTRMSFSRINEVIGMPNLIEIQKNSYNWFLEVGLHEVFHDIAAIEDYTGNLVLEFVDYRLDKTPKYTIKNVRNGTLRMQRPCTSLPVCSISRPARSRSRRSSWATSRS